MQRADERLCAEDHARRLWRADGPFQLERRRRLSDYPRHRLMDERGSHPNLSSPYSKKSRRDCIPSRYAITSAYFTTGPPANQDAFYSVFRRTLCINHADAVHTHIFLYLNFVPGNSQQAISNVCKKIPKFPNSPLGQEAGVEAVSPVMRSLAVREYYRLGMSRAGGDGNPSLDVASTPRSTGAAPRAPSPQAETPMR